MPWFTRKQQGASASKSCRKEAYGGLWYKTPKSKTVPLQVLKENAYVSPEDGYHVRIGPQEYFAILFDGLQYQTLDVPRPAVPPLQFVDTQPYTQRLQAAEEKTQCPEALCVAHGTIHAQPAVVACMHFDFMDGSMGVVAGEHLANAVDHAIAHKQPLITIARSRGIRTMEGSHALMQMAKTSAKLLQLSAAKLPHISVLTDPTTGGVAASFAMLGDLNIAEPGALIGFAAPHVVRESIHKELPEGFQTAESLLKHGFLDLVVDRRSLKDTLAQLLQMLAS